MVRVRVVVVGRVQGVGFRYFAQDAARLLGLSGWVRNRSDGSVEAEAQGEQDAVTGFIERLRQGPPLGHVRSLTHHALPVVAGEAGFEVRRDTVAY